MAILSSKLVISLIDQVSGPARRIKSSLSGIAGAAGTRGVPALGAALGAQLATLKRNAGTASATIAAPLALIWRSGFEAALGLEKMLNKVQAVGQLTGEQRGSLASYVQELNAIFPFTNQEIAGAALELFRAGFTYEQAVGSLKDTLSLALAGDISREEAADIATNVLTALRLPVQTTEQAAASTKRVADVLAYTANKSNTDVRLLGETFKYVAPLAAAAGLSLEDVAAGAATMANNGIKGSEAGVAMRAALVRMAKPTKDMLATLARLNINLGDFIKGGREIGAGDIVSGLQASGIDASGVTKQIEAALADDVLKLKPAQLVANLTDVISGALGDDSIVGKDKLAETLTDIVTASGKQIDLLGFTRALREKGVGVAEIARIMDVRQGARILTLLLDDIEKRSADTAANAIGAAEKMAQVMQQGIVGSVERLKAAWENLFVAIGKSGVLDSLASAFDRIAGALTSLSSTNPELLKLGTYALLALGAIGPLALVLQGVGATFALAGAGVRLAILPFSRMAASLLRVGAASRAANVATTALAAAPLFSLRNQRPASRGAAAAASQRLVTGLGANAPRGRLGGPHLPASALVNNQATERIAAGMSQVGLAAAAIPPGIGARLLGIARGLGAVVGFGARFTLVGAAFTAFATALGFLINNAAGIGSLLVGIGEGFMSNLGPARPVIEGIGNALSGILDWFGRITGPLDETGEKWRSWGQAIGSYLAEPVKWLGIMVQSLADIGSWLRDSAVGRFLFGERAPALPGLSLLDINRPGQTGAAAGALASPAVTPVTSVPAIPARQGADAADLAGVEQKARVIPLAVQDAMAQVRAIIAGVDLEADGQRIMESLARGLRAGAGAVRAAAQDAAAAQIHNAVRGAYGDVGR